MNEHTLNEIERLALAFGKEKVGSDRIELYVEQLADLPVEQLTAAVDRVIRTHRFFPTVSEILETWTDLMLGPPDPHGALEWCKTEHRRLAFEAEQRYWAQDVLTRGLQRPDAEMPSSWRDPVTQETVRLCGWDALFAMDDDFQFGYWAKRYAEARELVAKRLQTGDARIPLPTSQNVRSLKAVS